MKIWKKNLILFCKRYNYNDNNHIEYFLNSVVYHKRFKLINSFICTNRQFFTLHGIKFFNLNF